MPEPWKSLITVLSDMTRENSDSFICCPHCGNRHSYVKWGFYSRYLFDDDLINIQRYRCDNDLCPRSTFSILPHAFLPILRASLCMLMYILRIYEQGKSVAGIARCTGNNWPRIQRWIAKAVSVRNWLKQEYGHRSFCRFKIKQWTFFIRDFSWAFYPDRMR